MGETKEQMQPIVLGFISIVGSILLLTVCISLLQMQLQRKTHIQHFLPILRDLELHHIAQLRVNDQVITDTKTISAIVGALNTTIAGDYRTRNCCEGHTTIDLLLTDGRHYRMNFVRRKSSHVMLIEFDLDDPPRDAFGGRINKRTDYILTNIRIAAVLDELSREEAK